MIEKYTPENQDNIVSMTRAIQARHAYEGIHDISPNKNRFVVQRNDARILADPTTIAVWRGFEKGCANQLRAEGHNSAVNTIYEQLEGFMENGEPKQKGL